MAALRAGDVVAVDASPTRASRSSPSTLGLELAPLPSAEGGTDLDALERLCAARRVRAVYAMPTLHNPLGWVMDAPARARTGRDRAALRAAHHRGRLLRLPGRGTRRRRSPRSRPDVTVYVSGLSKSVATGLRVGFVAAPAALVPAIERAIRATTWNTPAMTTAIACRWLDDGTVGRLEAG